MLNEETLVFILIYYISSIGAGFLVREVALLCTLVDLSSLSATCLEGVSFTTLFFVLLLFVKDKLKNFKYSQNLSLEERYLLRRTRNRC